MTLSSNGSLLHRATIHMTPRACADGLPPSKGCGVACQNSGAVWTNCPINAGSRGLEENTGASVVSPLGLQKPLVVQSVNGHSMPSSRTSWKML